MVWLVTWPLVIPKLFVFVFFSCGCGGLESKKDHRPMWQVLKEKRLAGNKMNPLREKIMRARADEVNCARNVLHTDLGTVDGSPHFYFTFAVTMVLSSGGRGGSTPRARQREIDPERG